jgi:hypothetical protein
MGKGKLRDYGTTNETHSVISAEGSIKDIADEFGCVGQYIYSIRDGSSPDPFAYFKVWYAACVRAGVQYHIYDDALAAVRSRYRTNGMTLSPYALLTRKIKKDADSSNRILTALIDGAIDDTERQQIKAS